MSTSRAVYLPSPKRKTTSARSTSSSPGPKTNSTAASCSRPKASPAASTSSSEESPPDSAKKFHLGFAPDRWDWLLERARQSEWRPALLERAGLLRRREQGDGHYDWFRGRVMFSIRDARSRPVAFGGRVLPQLADSHAAKYINSPETPLFTKSRELYGLDIARENFPQAGGATIMEGYTDVIMAHQNGLDNAVAVLGTALGEQPSASPAPLHR